MSNASMVDCATSLLFAAGVAPNDVVVLTFPNTTEFALASLAVIRCGATAAPLNVGHTADEFEFYISDSEAELLITANEGNKSAEPAASKLKIPYATAMLNDDESELSLFPLSDITAELNSVAGISIDQSEVALFLHTSRTMSRPKGVLVTQLNLASSVRNMGSAYKFSESDSTMLVAPLFQANGLTVELLSSVAAGAAVVLPAACTFSVKTLWSYMRTYNAMRYTAAPIIHRITLYRHFELVEPAYPALRLLRSCVAWLTPSVLARLEEAFNSPVLEAYATTEASQMSTNLLPDGEGHKSGSVGKPVGLEMVILNPNGMPVKEGVSGKVYIWGPNGTKGYKNNPEANKGAFSLGWFHDEDVECFNSDGYLHLVGGIEEPVNRGEEIIAPIEVDEVILSHADVDRAVAFGVPDDKHGREHALGYTMPTIRHSINDSPARGEVDVEMATNVGANGVVAADVLPREDNLEDVIIDIEATGDEAAVPRQDNNLEDASERTIKKIGPQCVWALGCIITVLVAVAGLPIGRRFTLVICIVVLVAWFCRVLLTYLMWKKGTPENMDIP